MRVAGVFLRRHDGGVVVDEPLFAEPHHHLLLHRVLGDGVSGRESRADELERPILDAVELLGGGAMCRNRRGVPRRFEPPDEVARREAVVDLALDVAGLEHVRDQLANPLAPVLLAGRGVVIDVVLGDVVDRRDVTLVVLPQQHVADNLDG